MGTCGDVGVSYRAMGDIWGHGDVGGHMGTSDGGMGGHMGPSGGRMGIYRDIGGYGDIVWECRGDMWGHAGI